MAFQTIARHVDELLENENWFTLNRMIKADLIKLGARPIPAPSTPQLEAQSVRQSTIHNSDYFDDLSDVVDEIPFESIEMGKKLGSGGFKDCYAGLYLGQPVAVGELRITDFSPEDFAEIKHEISVLKQLRHENIVRFIGVSTNARRLCIITELCEHGDLFDYMRRTRKPGFAQMDLKSMNILISGDNRAKINDFGLARIRPRANTMIHTQCGTPNWQAPEFWTSNPSYTEKVDVYACGLIYWEILQWGAEPYPYHDFTEHQLYIQVRDRGYRPSLAKLRRYPQTLLDLIQDMWAHEPTKRPSMSQVVERLLDYLS
ncbi:hypothetical protein H4R33_000471 [Dimargaris cristalligena]|nr:hypothetical protein H4R33_000471 [Dimargaris cristalligena]